MRADRSSSTKPSTPKSVPFEEASRGYAQVDAGVATKYVLNGYIKS